MFGGRDYLFVGSFIHLFVYSFVILMCMKLRARRCRCISIGV